MAVSNQAIIHKMMQELHKATDHAENDVKMRQHIAHVKLLCDLVLEESPSTTPTDKKRISAAEMKAMMGNKSSMQQPNVASPSTSVTHGEANGESIFDF